MPALSPPPSQRKPSNWRGEILVSIEWAYCIIPKIETKHTTYRDQRIENLWRHPVMLTLQHKDYPTSSGSFCTTFSNAGTSEV